MPKRDAARRFGISAENRLRGRRARSDAGKFQRELSDAPAHGYELEEQVSAHLLLGSTGTVTVSLENSESFAAASGWERASPSRRI